MRQSINVNPGLKEFEAYMDFSGGLNTETSNERLLNNEFTVMQNVELGNRGAVKRRTGYSQYLDTSALTPPLSVQGIFHFYKPNESEPNIIIAQFGWLFYKSNNPNIPIFQIPITGLSVADGAESTSQFQLTRPVEAVQFYDKLYVASGCGLIEVAYNTQTGILSAKAITPYEPDSYEIKFIGTNSLLNYAMIDTNNPTFTTADFSVKGIVFTNGELPAKTISSGVKDTLMNIRAYVNYNSNLITGQPSYSFYFRAAEDNNWHSGAHATGVMVQYGTGSATFIPYTTELYDFKVDVTFVVNGNNITKTFEFTGFTVDVVQPPENVYIQQIAGVKRCNRILLHFNRLLLYGDTIEPMQMYASYLANPTYYPNNYVFRFDIGKKEPIVTIKRIQNYLAIFTKTTIYTLTGENPTEYVINMINDSVGCIAERSAAVTGNVITFLSQEGVFILRPSTFKLDQLNVQRVDAKIKSEMPKDTNACAISFDSQYILCFPDKKVTYRYYYEQGAWVKDVSDEQDFLQFLIYTNKLYGITKKGKVYLNNKTVYKDGIIGYDMIVETKYFDLSKSFNFKKLKRIHVLGKCYEDYDAEFKTYVYADAALVLDPEIGTASIVNNVVVWNMTITPNVIFEHGSTFGIWELSEDVFGQQPLSVSKARIRGKCRRVKVRFVQSQDKEVELYGLGLEFKLKKP